MELSCPVYSEILGDLKWAGGAEVQFCFWWTELSSTLPLATTLPKNRLHPHIYTKVKDENPNKIFETSSARIRVENWKCLRTSRRCLKEKQFTQRPSQGAGGEWGALLSTGTVACNPAGLSPRWCRCFGCYALKECTQAVKYRKKHSKTGVLVVKQKYGSLFSI